MYYKSNPSNYTRCDKCKHIDRKKEECKITNDKWLVSDKAGTCHQFEGVSMKVKPINSIRGAYRLVALCDKEYDVVREEGEKFVIINEQKEEKAYDKSWFKIVEDKKLEADLSTEYHIPNYEEAEAIVKEAIVKTVSKHNAIKPSYYKTGNFDVIAFCFEHDLDFATGNIIKYVTRAGKKDKSKTLEDLLKAKEYLERKIERVKSND